ERAGREPALALGRGTVMHDGAVGAGAGDGGKAQIAEMLAHTAELLEPVGRSDLAEIPLGRGIGEPSEKARQRRAVATMRAPCAVQLNRVIAPLGKLPGWGGGLW